MHANSRNPRLFSAMLWLCLVTAFSFATSVRSHVYSDPDGSTLSWYPRECCHDEDCQPVAKVRVSPEGLWMTTVGGQTVLVSSDEPRRPSRDMRWHLCLGAVGHNDIGIQCLFEPPASSNGSTLGEKPLMYAVRFLARPFASPSNFAEVYLLML